MSSNLLQLNKKNAERSNKSKDKRYSKSSPQAKSVVHDSAKYDSNKIGKLYIIWISINIPL